MPAMDQFAAQIGKPIDTSGIATGATNGMNMAEAMYKRKQAMEVHAREMQYKQDELKQKKSQYFLDEVGKVSKMTDKFMIKNSITRLKATAQNMEISVPEDLYEGLEKSEEARQKFFQLMSTPEFKKKINTGGANEFFDVMQQAQAQGGTSWDEIDKLWNTAQKSKIAQQKADAQSTKTDLSAERLEESKTKGRTTAVAKVNGDLNKVYGLVNMAEKDIALLDKPVVYIRDAKEAMKGVTRLITGQNRVAFGMDQEMDFTPYKQTLTDIFSDKLFKGKETAKIPKAELEIMRDRTHRLGASLVEFIRDQHEMGIDNLVATGRVDDIMANNLRSIREQRLGKLKYFGTSAPRIDGLKPSADQGDQKPQAQMSPEQVAKYKQMPEASLRQMADQALKSGKPKEQVNSFFKQITGKDL